MKSGRWKVRGSSTIDDEVFRKLVKARLAYPASKAATVEYLKNHFDDDVSLSRIYRYLDRLSDSQQNIVQEISVEHTRRILGGHIGVLFYDVTTLYFGQTVRTICAGQAFQRKAVKRIPR